MRIDQHDCLMRTTNDGMQLASPVIRTMCDPEIRRTSQDVSAFGSPFALTGPHDMVYIMEKRYVHVYNPENHHMNLCNFPGSCFHSNPQ